MRNSINFVKKGLTSNNPVEIYKYLSIKDGSVQSNNGIFAMSTPIGLDAEVVPVGYDFMRAMSKCEDAISMSMLA